MEHLVDSFAYTCINLPSKKPTAPVSATELCRIRRAFWRFQLLYGILHPEGCTTSSDDLPQAPKERSAALRMSGNSSASSINIRIPDEWWCETPIFSGDMSPAPLSLFLCSICQQEISEIKAVRKYLVDATNTDQYQLYIGQIEQEPSQPLLLRKLFHNLVYGGPGPIAPKYHIFIKYLLALGDMTRGSTPWTYRVTSWVMSPITRWVDSGSTWPAPWCTWDEERLVRCGLLAPCGDILRLPEPDTKPNPVDKWLWKWKDDYDRRALSMSNERLTTWERADLTYADVLD